MGGGDLNLKKSWHPHTMKNQEKVWKAEQAKNEEDRKMNDLRREIMEERNREDLIKMGQSSGVLAKSDDKKLEWMYKSASELINREDYLLGRPIDKAFEMMEEEEKNKDTTGMKQPINHVEHECIPFSIRSYRNATSTEQVDLQRKILEDPLMMIKQKEMESRRKILENPVKLKELHRILKIEKTKLLDSEAKSSKKTKKSKKSKKSKKKKRHSSDSDSDKSEHSDEDLDEMLQKQYKKLKDKDGNQLAGLDLSKLLDAKYETISKELDKAAHSKKKKKKGKSKKSRKDRSSSSESSSTSSDSERDKVRETNNKRYQRERSRSPVDRRNRDRGNRQSSVDRRDERRDNNRYPSERRNWNVGNRDRNNYRTDNRSQKKSRSRSPQKRDQFNRRSRSPANSMLSSRNNREETRSKAPTQKPRLTEEEKEQRLKDMMANADWRDKERTRSVQKYREGYEKEEKQYKTSEFDKEFINTQLRKAISTQNSVESRIRSNVNNIQRTSAAMNANFARK